MAQNTYLDYNATAPLRPEALAALRDALMAPHNASSIHSFGRMGRQIIETARARVAALCSAAPAQIIFNSGASEGNNTVIAHFTNQRILLSAIEHPSVMEAVKACTQNFALIPVTKEGVIDLTALEILLQSEPAALVCVMAVNNETGIIQPINEISRLAHKYGALYHCDGVQAAGRIALDIAASGIDFLTLSAHKIGGPQGTGALVLGLCGLTPHFIFGGQQEKGARAGTENVAGIAGFGAAAQAVLAYKGSAKNLAVLQTRLETEIQRHAPSAIIYGLNALRVAGTTLFSVPGISAETALMALDLDGVAISSGSACSSGRVEASQTLKAMGVEKNHASCAIRVSMGWATTPEDVEAFLSSWRKLCIRLEGKIKAHA
ncbi:MAG: cysteine desulfurase [Alphaproteobacteria bacterium]|nr:cysteine desulfurase [Alphaproteobacteria bacterium]